MVRHVEDRRLAAHDLTHAASVGVEAHDGELRAELDGERKPDVSETDDSDARGTIVNARLQRR